MKSFFTLLLSLFSFTSVFGQIGSVNVTSSEVAGDCSRYLNVTVNNGVAPETGAIINISWGDGYTTSDTIDVAGGNSETFSFSHPYLHQTTYTASVQAWSSVSQAPAGNPVTIGVINPLNPLCGTAQFYITNPSEGILYTDVVLDFAANDGAITTLHPSYQLDPYSAYIGLDINKSPYTIKINEDWLSDNNLRSSVPQGVPGYYYDADENGVIDHLSMDTGNGDFELSCAFGCRSAIIETSRNYQTYTNVPYDFTQNGVTITRFPENGNFYKDLPDLDPNHPCYINVNSTWLSNNHLVQTIPDIIFYQQGLESIYVDVACGSCGDIKVSTSTPLDPQISDVPYDFTDINGTIQTILPFNNTDLYTVPDISVAPFTLAVNQNWLTEKNLTQVSPDFVVTFPNGGNDVSDPWNQQVELACDQQGIPDFAIKYAYAGPFIAPLESGSIHLKICNYSCSDTSDVMVTITFPSFMTPDITGLINPVISADTLTFEVHDIYNNCQTIVIPCTFPGSTIVGTQLFFTANVTDPNGTETNFDNNDIIFEGNVSNSYDPNVKNCTKSTYISTSEKDVLQYIVHFQNEGNFPAMKVVIKDTISEFMDLSTFRLLESKHPVSYAIDAVNRIVTFTFQNVFLAPKDENEEASKGFVVYAVTENENLADQTEINNTAYIYFDFNPAIVTNTTSNINATLGMNELSELIIQMYPNPAGEMVYIETEGLMEVSVNDFTGKQILWSDNDKINTSSLSNGIYMVSIKTAKGFASRKLVIQK